MAEDLAIDRKQADSKLADSNWKVGELIEMLDSPQFTLREAAATELRKLGEPAISPLQEAASAGASLELALRAVSVLRELAVHSQESTRTAAVDALGALADQKVTAAADQAASALQFVQAIEQDVAIDQMLDLGGAFGDGTVENGDPKISHVILGEKWEGGSEGMKLLKKMPRLDTLSVHRAKVDDLGAVEIAQLKNLKRLELYGTDVTDDGLRQIREGLPQVEIDLRKGALLGVGGSQSTIECRISYVRSESAAEKAGMMAGDVVVEFEGKPVDNFQTLTKMIATKKGGDKVTLVVDRSGERLTMPVTLDWWK